MEDCTCLMIGMPASGKTTYLASLVHMLTMNKTKTALHLDNADLPTGIEKIQQAIDNFTCFQPVGRTIETAEDWLEIRLYNNYEQSIKLHIPDLSGEIFRDLVKQRQIKKDFADSIQLADMLLFFINCDTISEERRISLKEESALQMIAKGYSKEIIQESKAYSIEGTLEKQAQITQSDLVELLQCVMFLAKKRSRINFVVSAWDSVEKRLSPSDRTPVKCLEKILPLFSQFLQTNYDKIDGKIWGVSAQGFDFTNEDELKRWERDDIGSRVRVITPDNKEIRDLSCLLLLN